MLPAEQQPHRQEAAWLARREGHGKQQRKHDGENVEEATRVRQERCPRVSPHVCHHLHLVRRSVEAKSSQSN